jgi:hypothetical protein
MKPHLRPKKAPLSALTVDNLVVSRRIAKEILKKQGPQKRTSLLMTMINTYRFRHKLIVDVGQMTIAMRQLIAEGDIIDTDGIVALAKHTKPGGRHA